MKKISYDELLQNPYETKEDPNNKVDLVKKVAKLEAYINKINQKINEDNESKEELKSMINIQQQNINYYQNKMSNDFDRFTDSFNKALTNIKDIILDEVNDKLDKYQQSINNITLTNENTTINETETPKIKHKNKVTQSQSNNISNSIDLSSQKINDRLNKIEAFLAIPLPNRDTEINSNIAKVSFLEKKVDTEFNNINTDIQNIKKYMLGLKNEIDELKTMKNNKDNLFNKFQKDFIDTNKNLSQLVYQNTMIIKENVQKIKKIEEGIRKENESLQLLKNDVINNTNQSQEIFNDNLNKNKEWINNIENHLKNKQNEFQNNLVQQNNKFIDFIQEKFNNFTELINTSVQDTQTKTDANQNNIIEFNQKYTDIQKIIFQQINEMEECINNKFDLVYKKLNIPF